MGRGAKREAGEATAAYAKRWAYCPSCPRCGKTFAGYIFLLDHLHAKHNTSFLRVRQQAGPPY